MSVNTGLPVIEDFLSNIVCQSTSGTIILVFYVRYLFAYFRARVKFISVFFELPRK